MLAGRANGLRAVWKGSRNAPTRENGRDTFLFAAQTGKLLEDLALILRAECDALPRLERPNGGVYDASQSPTETPTVETKKA
jgi:hypothetical protein